MSGVGDSNCDIYLNGEPAPLDDIVFMERISADMLAQVPVEEHRQYGYRTESGAIVLFKSFRNDTDRPGEVFAAVALAQEDYSNSLFEIIYGTDNTPYQMGYNTEEQLHSAALVAAELLESEQLDTDEAAILDFIMKIVLGIEDFLKDPGHQKLPEAAKGEGARFVGDVVRKLVAEKSGVAVHVREYGKELANGNSVRIIEHVIAGNVDLLAEEIDMPRLQIEYTDNESGVSYLYSRGNDGTAHLETAGPEDLTDEFDGNDTGYTEEDVAVEALMEQLKASNPGKTHVQTIIDALVAASAEELTANLNI